MSVAPVVGLNVALSRRIDPGSHEEEKMLDIPMSAFPASQTKLGLRARIWRALQWPARVMEARQTRAQLAELSERELQDISAGREILPFWATMPLHDNAADRRARTLAVRAWHHGRDAKAA